MKRILIDTNVYSAFKVGNAEVLERLQSAEYIGMSAIVLGKLHGGFKVGKKEKRNLLELDEFLSSPRVGIIPIDEDTAEYYAAVFRNLRKAGTPIPTNDLWIAASALQHGLALYNLDTHFRAVAGLILV